MKSLKEFNDERRRQWQELNDPRPRPNGILCPDCGEELLDASPLSTLASYPPQKWVICKECNFRGLRLA